MLIIDNARYYYNSEVFEYVSKSKQLEMIFLPAYSSNLNLDRETLEVHEEKDSLR